MELIENIKVDFNFCDSRGSLTQLVHNGQEQVNVLITHAGVERGGHYHKISNESFYVIKGSVQVTAKKDEIVEKHLFRENDFFRIKPFVVHSMYFPEECILVAMYDKSVELDNGTKDIYSA